MQQVKTQTVFKPLRTARFQTYSIIAACIVDQAIKPPIAAGNLLDGRPALIRFREFCDDQFARQSLAPCFGKKLLYVPRIMAENNNVRTFGQAGARDSLANTRSA